MDGSDFRGSLDALAEVARLAALTSIEYELERQAVAKRLGMRPKVLDAEVGALHRAAAHARRAASANSEPARWQDRLQRDEKDEALPNLANAALALRQSSDTMA